MQRKSDARVKNGQCQQAFLEPTGHGSHHVKKILVTPRLQGILQYKKSTEKHATQQKVKPKSKKAKFAPQFL